MDAGSTTMTPLRAARPHTMPVMGGGLALERSGSDSSD